MSSNTWEYQLANALRHETKRTYNVQTRTAALVGTLAQVTPEVKITAYDGEVVLTSDMLTYLQGMSAQMTETNVGKKLLLVGDQTYYVIGFVE